MFQRKVKAGALFVAIPGSNYDGHDFIPDALKRGANVVIGEKLWTWVIKHI